MKSLKLSMAIAIACTFGIAVSAGAAEMNRVGSATGNSAAKSQSKFSAEQLAEIQLRMDLANQIARNVAEDAHNTGALENWRATLMNTLLVAHSSALRDIANSAKTVFDARSRAAEAIAQGQQGTSVTANVSSALGSATDSLVYTPIAPCRFVDTRKAGGQIDTTPRRFSSAVVAVAYGGDNGCFLPGLGEPAIAANVTLVAPATSAGYLAVRPANSTNVTSWLNFNQSGPTVAVANQGVISTAPDSKGYYAFDVFVVGGPADVVIDYFGYFSAAAPTALDCVNIPTTDVTLPPDSSGSYPATTCPAGYAVTAPACYNYNDKNVYVGGSGISNNTSGPGSSAFCEFINRSTVSATASVGASCCRVP